MKQSYRFAVAVVIVALCYASWAADKKVKFEDLPAPVQQTARTESAGATVRGYSTEVENGRTEYEVQLTVNGRKRDVSIDSSGKVLERETEIELKSVPEAARQGLEKLAAGGHIDKVEEVTSDRATAYEAVIHGKKGKREIRVLADGRPARD
jgi:head-tail adaptor